VQWSGESQWQTVCVQWSGESQWQTVCVQWSGESQWQTVCVCAVVRREPVEAYFTISNESFCSVRDR
jgi:hypothetical protein